MNWYNLSKKSALEPDAWQWHENTHRLLRDMPTVKTPFGTIPQKVKPQQDLAQDYQGVHATQDIQLAAVYANSLATPEDPPVIIEITNTQAWENDIDAINDALDSGIIFDDWFGHLDYDIQDAIKNRGRRDIEDVVSDIMDDIANIDLTGYDDDDWDGSQGVSDVISSNAKRKWPSSFMEYWQHYYGDKAVLAFYHYFLEPILEGSNEVDTRYKGWMVNQMRFMNPVPEEQISAIYTFQPFEDEINDDWKEDSDEENEEEDNYKQKLTYEDLDYGGISPTKVWQNTTTSHLFPEAFDTYYHGTSLSRAMVSLPGLQNILRRISPQPKTASRLNKSAAYQYGYWIKQDGTMLPVSSAFAHDTIAREKLKSSETWNAISKGNMHVVSQSYLSVLSASPSMVTSQQIGSLRKIFTDMMRAGEGEIGHKIQIYVQLGKGNAKRFFGFTDAANYLTTGG